MPRRVRMPINKVIRITIDTEQRKGFNWSGIVENFINFVNSLFELLGIEIFSETYDEEYDE